MQIQLKNVVKTFGENVAVDNVSFEAYSGHVFGLLGRNGAGKTTTMRMIMDVFKPDSGKITVDGKEIDRKALRFGYLPEERGLYPKLEIKTQLLYLAELNGLGKSEALTQINYWLGKFEMSDSLDKKLSTLSKGNQQKIQLASVLLNNPDIIILDEPFSGLDPVNADALKQIILELMQEDKILIFSSHQMSNIEEICDEIVILDKGKPMLLGNLNDIKNKYPKKHINLTGTNINAVKSYLDETAADMIESMLAGDISLDIYLKREIDRNKILDIVAGRNFEIDSFMVVKPSLNEIFINVSKEVAS